MMKEVWNYIRRIFIAPVDNGAQKSHVLCILLLDERKVLPNAEMPCRPGKEEPPVLRLEVSSPKATRAAHLDSSH